MFCIVNRSGKIQGSVIDLERALDHMEAAFEQCGEWPRTREAFENSMRNLIHRI